MYIQQMYILFVYDIYRIYIIYVRHSVYTLIRRVYKHIWVHTAETKQKREKPWGVQPPHGASKNNLKPSTLFRLER